MSGHKYISNSANLFDEDDVDDETFLKNNFRHENRGRNTNPFLDQQQQLSFDDRRKQIEDRTLDSSYRSISLLRETEQIGISTAEELSRQREQLEKTSKQLDDINTTLRFSQKHINGLKSVFGGLKNYLSGQKDMNPRLGSAASDGKLSDRSSTTIQNSNENLSQQSCSAMQPAKFTQEYTQYHQHQQQKRATGGVSTNFNEQLDKNLDEMAGNLSRLKGLAIDLNQDIELQNDLIDTIGNKVDNVDIKIKRQNKDMNHLLGKK